MYFKGVKAKDNYIVDWVIKYFKIIFRNFFLTKLSGSQKYF